MQIKSLYIAAQQKNAGTLFVTMGMMDLLKKNLHRVAFFRPVIFSREQRDGDISFILTRYNLAMEYEECFGYDVSEVERFIAQKREDEMLENLISHYKRLEERFDFVLCEGIRKSFLSSTIAYDLNLKIAQNFAAPYINIISAKEKRAEEVAREVLIEHNTIKHAGVSHFATFLNRVSPEQKATLAKHFERAEFSLYLLEELEALNLPTLGDVIETLSAKPLILQPYDTNRTIRGVKVAALTLDNFLEHIEEDDLVIVPADRSEIILGLYGALHSRNYPNISAILFPFAMDIHPNIARLINGLDAFLVPILSVESDTFTTAKRVTEVHARLRISQVRKIALALGLFYKSVAVSEIEEKIAKTSSEIVTPQMFEYKLFAMAQQKKKCIVLPESSDERILRAAEMALRRGIAKIILLGKKDEVREHAMRLGLDLEEAEILNPEESGYMEEFVERFYQMRKAKGLTKEAARDALKHLNYFGVMMVACGYADGMVSGAIHSTADTMRPALQILKTKEGVSLVSSVFFICFETRVLVYGDCAINKDPNAHELAEIAIASADTAAAFGIEPRVAMLSYSTGESGSGADVQKVREATELVKQKRPNLPVDGPIQYDAAISKEVARIKLPDSKVAGRATVFVFPDLNTGNNTYKAVQRSSGAVAIGPIIQGLKKPVNDLSRGALIKDIVNTIAITAIQAQQ